MTQPPLRSAMRSLLHPECLQYVTFGKEKLNQYGEIVSNQNRFANSTEYTDAALRHCTMEFQSLTMKFGLPTNLTPGGCLDEMKEIVRYVHTSLPDDLPRYFPTLAELDFLSLPNLYEGRLGFLKGLHFQVPMTYFQSLVSVSRNSMPSFFPDILRDIVCTYIGRDAVVSQQNLDENTKVILDTPLLNNESLFFRTKYEADFRRSPIGQLTVQVKTPHGTNFYAVTKPYITEDVFYTTYKCQTRSESLDDIDRAWFLTGKVQTKLVFSNCSAIFNHTSTVRQLVNSGLTVCEIIQNVVSMWMAFCRSESRDFLQNSSVDMDVISDGDPLQHSKSHPEDLVIPESFLAKLRVVLIVTYNKINEPPRLDPDTKYYECPSFNSPSGATVRQHYECAVANTILIFLFSGKAVKGQVGIQMLHNFIANLAQLENPNLIGAVLKATRADIIRQAERFTGYLEYPEGGFEMPLLKPCPTIALLFTLPAIKFFKADDVHFKKPFVWVSTPCCSIKGPAFVYKPKGVQHELRHNSPDALKVFTDTITTTTAGFSSLPEEVDAYKKAGFDFPFELQYPSYRSMQCQTVFNTEDFREGSVEATLYEAAVDEDICEASVADFDIYPPIRVLCTNDLLPEPMSEMIAGAFSETLLDLLSTFEAVLENEKVDFCTLIIPPLFNGPSSYCNQTVRLFHRDDRRMNARKRPRQKRCADD